MPRRTRKKSRKSVPWKGWSKIAPKGKQRTTMYRKCGKKCFLGTKTNKVLLTLGEGLKLLGSISIIFSIFIFQLDIIDNLP